MKQPKFVQSKNSNNSRKISSQSQLIDQEDIIDKRPRFDSNIEDDIEVNLKTSLKPKRPLLAVNTGILRQNSTQAGNYSPLPLIQQKNSSSKTNEEYKLS